jgi:hypothetical protein
MGNHYYLNNLLSNCLTKNIIGVIATETIQEDLQNIFNIKISRHEKNNNKYDKQLSEKGYKNLKRYLKKDYACIEALRDLNSISEKQYQALMQ